MSDTIRVLIYVLRWSIRAFYVCGVSLLFLTPTFASECGKSPQTLTVSLLIFSSAQREVFEEVAENFSNRCPNILVNYRSTDDEGYKLASEKWLRANPDIDVLLWLWSADLKMLVSDNLVEPVTDLWQERQMQHHREDIKTFITYDHQQFAVPVSMGFWGLYYNTELFNKLGINRVESWGDLLHACKVLARNNIVPVALGTKEKWPVFAWFDYLNLRMNGLPFHEKVMTGKVPFTDERMVAVFQQWKILIDSNCFLGNAEQYTDKQVVPLLFRQQAGVILSGNYVISQLPEYMRMSIEFTPFPSVYDNVNKYEISTVDYFIISSNSRNKEIAKSFLRYISSEGVQAFINERIDHLPVHPNAEISHSELVKAGSQNLSSANGLVQYFDRAVEKVYYAPFMTILVDFVSDGDVEKAIAQLEALRKNVFSVDSEFR